MERMLDRIACIPHITAAAAWSTFSRQLRENSEKLRAKRRMADAEELTIKASDKTRAVLRYTPALKGVARSTVGSG